MIIKRRLAILWVFLLAFRSAYTEEIQVDSTGLALIDAAVVSASDNGQFIEIMVREGRRVRAGDLLAKLDSSAEEVEVLRLKSEQRTASARASNDVLQRIAEKELAVAELEVKRAADLNLKFANTVSVSQMERLVLVQESKRLAVEYAKRELKLAGLVAETAARSVDAAELKLKKRTLYSPIDGIVVDVQPKVGEWVQGGSALCRVVRTDRLQAEAYIPYAQLTSELEGEAATILVSIPGKGQRGYDGVVTFVSPEANPVSGTVKVVAHIDNQDGQLRAGYVGTLIIRRAGDSKQLETPLKAASAELNSGGR